MKSEAQYFEAETLKDLGQTSMYVSVQWVRSDAHRIIVVDVGTWVVHLVQY